jgi:hypothetical protein
LRTLWRARHIPRSANINGFAAWHTRCWNEAAEERAARYAELDDREGFALYNLPDEASRSLAETEGSEEIKRMATATNTHPQREVVDFPPNTPVTVSLKYGQGRTISSQYGERFMFSLADGRVMFLDPPVAGQIAELGINVRENFTITRQTDDRKDSSHTWHVARIAGEQSNGTFAVPALPASSQSATARSIDAGLGGPPVAPKPPAQASTALPTPHADSPRAPWSQKPTPWWTHTPWSWSVPSPLTRDASNRMRRGRY